MSVRFEGMEGGGRKREGGNGGVRYRERKIG
jgi:hypothetical protein